MRSYSEPLLDQLFQKKYVISSAELVRFLFEKGTRRGQRGRSPDRPFFRRFSRHGGKTGLLRFRDVDILSHCSIKR